MEARLKNLRELCMAATPGPWLHEKENVHAGGVCSVNQGGEPWFEVWSPNWMDAPEKNNEADASYIAAANPAEILELIAKLEDAQGEIRALRATEAGLIERVKELEEGVAGFKVRVNTLAALGLKAERFDFGGRLKYDMTALLEKKE